MADEPPKVRVWCAVVGGLRLELHEKVDVGLGIMQYRPKKGVAAVTVPYGESEVDEVFFDEWAAQHAEDAVIREGKLRKWPRQQP